MHQTMFDLLQKHPAANFYPPTLKLPSFLTSNPFSKMEQEVTSLVSHVPCIVLSDCSPTRVDTSKIERLNVR